MFRAFKVPVGVNEEEAAKLKYYFAEQKIKEKKRWFHSLAFWRKEKNLDDAADGYLNDHSRALYLMAPDNKFLAFYSLDLDEKELATQLVEDISYDFGVSHIGTKNTPL
jgi:cytochrome oxidase Cu insertion factor (SCO1/SenC/PrrC family)